MTNAQEISSKFESVFGLAPAIYRAPGRVNLIGEHTDYNDGFVMPAAIDFYTWVGISPRKDRKLAISSANFSETIEMNLDDHSHKRNSWFDYPVGVAVT